MRRQPPSSSFFRRSFSNVIQPEKSDTLKDDYVKCLTLHPVTWPNHGPQIELYLAEEAIGLVRSLNWQVEEGPYWKDQEEKENAEEGSSYDNEAQTEMITEDTDAPDAEGGRKSPGFTQRRKMQRLSHSANYRNFMRENIKDGDYVFAPEMQGVYYPQQSKQRGGIILEFDDDDQYDIYDEWKNELRRESIAKSGLIKIRKIHSGTYFTKGKLNEIGMFLKEKSDVNVVFINTQLTALQQKKLEKRFNDIVLSREDRVRKYFLKSAQKERYNPTDVESDTQVSDVEADQIQKQMDQSRSIRVVDRFGIILQIFAHRAKTRAAQLQIELAWLAYARTMLVRGGAPTFGQLGNIFQGNMMRMEVQQVEIKSARGRKASGAMGGEGETQLEMERRRLTDREAKINKELEQIQTRKEHENKKRESQHSTLPMVALVGYTNAGKTALMNLVTGSHLESQNLLFQTLNTTIKKFRLPDGQMAVMLDTVGFITNLPHGLVESFKQTLEEIHQAELIIHVRDISHPQTNYQRDTVIKVLREIGIDDSMFSSNRYIEVWNKVDLLEEQGDEWLDSLKQDMAQTKMNYPVIPMSCTKGTNKDLLLQEISALAAINMGKKQHVIKYPYEKHQKVQRWMQEQANVANYEEGLEYEEDGIVARLDIDDVTYQKYLKEFEPEAFEEERQRSKQAKWLPPADWNK